MTEIKFEQLQARVAALEKLVSVLIGVQVQYLSAGDLEKRFTVNRSTLWRWYQKEKFPQPKYINNRRVWDLKEVEQWEQEKLASKPARTAKRPKRAGDVVKAVRTDRTH